MPKELPLVSCLMMTYNKPPGGLWLVEEAIESFTRQDYPNKELVVVNDCPRQQLHLAHEIPGVTIVNLPIRCRSLGEKVNVCAALTTGDVLFRWDDDDIYLPWRLSLSVERMGNASYWKPTNSWWNHLPELKPNVGPFAASCFTRDGFNTVGGYPHMGVGEDQIFEQSFHKAQLKVTIGKITQAEAFYLYRWGTNSIHVSGYGPNGYEACAKNRITSGNWTLRPHWRHDYVAMTRQLVEQGASL